MLRLLALLLAAIGCNDGGSVCEEPPDQSAATSYVGLAPLELQAVGSVRVLPADRPDAAPIDCSGVLIAPSWALTAAHCALGLDAPEVSFALGPSRTRPLRRVAAGFHPHPSADVALLSLEEVVTADEATPLPVLLVLHEPDWLGKSAESAGYGEHPDAPPGSRELFAERIARFGDTTIGVDALGRTGTCYGDSGAPLLARDAAGRLRVLGVLSEGSATCGGSDRFARLDPVADWITQQTGVPRADADGCGGVNTEGLCLDGAAIHCAAGELRAEPCVDDAPCGWDPAQAGYRCRSTASDPCEGVDQHGTCRATAAIRCSAGELLMRDCATCGEVCGASSAGRASCLPP